MRRLWVFGFIATALLAFSVNAQAATIVIDEFADFQMLTATGPIGANTDESAVAASVLGGERDMFLRVLGGASSQKATAVAFDLGGGANSLFLSQQSTIKSSLLLTYDGGDGDADPSEIDYTGLGGFDLRGGGTEFGLELGVNFRDQPVDVTFTVYDASDASGNTWSRETITLSGPSFVPQAFTIPYGHFTTHGPNGGVNFSNVGAVTMEIGAFGAGTDLEIDYLRTSVVPEPSSIVIALVGSALCGLNVLRRRRKRTA